MPEWSNGMDSRSIGSVPTKVQILSPALFAIEQSEIALIKIIAKQLKNSNSNIKDGKKN